MTPKFGIDDVRKYFQKEDRTNPEKQPPPPTPRKRSWKLEDRKDGIVFLLNKIFFG